MMIDAEVAARAVVETLRYLAEIDYCDDSDPRLASPRLIEWAKTVETIASRVAAGDFACCPFCAEVDCDDDCPLRHWPRGAHGWLAVPDDAVEVVVHESGLITYALPDPRG